MGDDKDGDDGEVEEKKDDVRARIAKRREERLAKRPQGKLQARNKRFFGSLMGQLHKANKRLKSELTSEVVQKKVIAEKKVEQRISQVRDNAQFTEMKDIKVKRAAQLDDKERVLKAQQSTRLQLLEMTLVAHAETMSGFIKTTAGPPVYWLPRDHTDTTREALEECKQLVAKGSVVVDMEKDVTFLDSMGERERVEMLGENYKEELAKLAAAEAKKKEDEAQNGKDGGENSGDEKMKEAEAGEAEKDDKEDKEEEDKESEPAAEDKEEKEDKKSSKKDKKSKKSKKRKKKKKSSKSSGSDSSSSDSD